MTQDELLAKMNNAELGWFYQWMQDALIAVVQLHKPVPCNKTDTNAVIYECGVCKEWPSYSCNALYPCSTIQAITKAFE